MTNDTPSREEIQALVDQSMTRRMQDPLVQQNMRDAQPVLDDLGAAGFAVQTIAGLYGHGKQIDYRGALPVLLKWLPVVANRDVKADIVRALAVRWARPAAGPPLVKEFRRTEPDSSLQWAIGNALHVVAGEDVIPELLEIAADSRCGKSRQMILLRLGRERNNPNVVRVLMSVMSDPSVTGHAIAALGTLRAQEARAAIEPYLVHENPWIRKEAKNALARIGEAADRL